MSQGFAINSPGSASSQSGVGGNGNLLQSLLASLQGQTNAANAQNLKQYNGLMGAVNNTSGLVNNLYSQQNGLLANAGQTQHSLLDLNTANQMGKNDQDLVSRGLDNTSIRSTTGAGIQRNAALEGNQIDENVNQQKLALSQQQAQGQMQLGQMRGDALLSRQNQAPDLSSYLGLIGQLGQTAGRAAAPQGPSSSQMNTTAGWTANGYNPAFALTSH